MCPLHSSSTVPRQPARAVAPAAEPAAEGEPEPEGEFQFPWSRRDPLDDRCIRAHATLHGVLFSIMAAAFALSAGLLTRQFKKRRYFVFASIAAAFSCTLRAIFFLLDPYHADELMPRMLTGYVYGFPFPILNLLVPPARVELAIS